MRYVWLDCDPGHDDATAILLAVHCPDIQLLGVSTVHGNASAQNTETNAARCLHAFGAPDHIRVHPGATKPLLRPTRHDPEIHGTDGLGGVEGLPAVTDPGVRARLGYESRPVRAIEGMANAIREKWKDGIKTTIVASGPLTNIALFVSVYDELVEAIEEIVFMGGGVGIGNRSAVAEFNVLCDPEAAQIVLDVPVPTTMVPLNVTHTAIVTKQRRAQLLDADGNDNDDAPLPKAATNLRHTLSTVINFFAESYKSTFGFMDGPPLHDALTIAYVSRPELFSCKRYRVDVELHGELTAGETVVDVWNYKSCDNSWGRGGKNCVVLESFDIPGFFNLFLDCVTKCDKITPLNR